MKRMISMALTTGLLLGLLSTVAVGEDYGVSTIPSHDIVADLEIEDDTSVDNTQSDNSQTGNSQTNHNQRDEEDIYLPQSISDGVAALDYTWVRGLSSGKGTKEFSSLEEAMSMAGRSETISWTYFTYVSIVTVTENCALSDEINVGRNITLNLDGNTVQMDDVTFDVKSLCDFTITGGALQGNITLEGSGDILVTDATITGKLVNDSELVLGDGTAVKGTVVNQTFADLTLNGGVLDGDNQGTVLENHGVFYMKSGTITGGNGQQGGGIYNTGVISLTGGSITDNQAVQGGGIYNHGSITMMGGSITGNTATQRGGGVYQGDALLDTFGVSGKIMIAGNTDDQNGDSNIYLPRWQTLTVGKLEQGSSIGVSTAILPTWGVDVTVALGDVRNGGYFFADGNYGIGTVEGGILTPDAIVIQYLALSYVEDILQSAHFAVEAESAVQAKEELENQIAALLADAGMTEVTCEVTITHCQLADGDTDGKLQFNVTLSDGEGNRNQLSDLDGVLTATGGSTGEKHSISGTVCGGDGKKVEGATVTLTQRGTAISLFTTDADGQYSFTADQGAYQLVASKGGVDATVSAVVTDSDVTKDITITEYSSKLVVEHSVPDVVVDNLDSASKNTSITLTVQSSTDSQAEEKIINKSNKDNYAYLEMLLTDDEKTGEDAILTQTEGVLEIIIPYNLDEKYNVAVYRQHGDRVDTFRGLSKKPTASFEDGTFYLDLEHHRIYVYTNKFSTYAVAYDDHPTYTVSKSYPITVNQPQGCVITLGEPSAKLGEQVTVTAQLAEGYTLSVTKHGTAQIEYVDKGEGTYTFTMPGTETVVVTAVMAENSTAQDDLLLWATQQGIVSGVAGLDLAVDGQCTRAQLAYLLWTVAGQPQPTAHNPFQDVAEDADYFQAVIWGYETGVIKGISETTFAPEAPCTRAHIATMVWRHLGEVAGDDTVTYQDVHQEDYYYHAALWATAQGVVAGDSDTHFNPHENSTVYEILALLRQGLMQ